MIMNYTRRLSTRIFKKMIVGEMLPYFDDPHYRDDFFAILEETSIVTVLDVLNKDSGFFPADLHEDLRYLFKSLY